MAVSTAELMKSIQIAIDMGEFARDNRDEFLHEQPNNYLNRMLSEKSLKLSDACALSELDSSYCYRILSGARTPSRNALLHITLTMGLSVDETQQALRLYQLERLDPRCYRDAAILFAVSRSYSLAETSALLCELGEGRL